MLQNITSNKEYTKNIITLLTGTAFAQAVPILVSPILTRIYTPDDFGVFALFMSIALIFGSITSARYDMAIMLPKSINNSIQLFYLGLIITAGITICLSIIFYIFSYNIAMLLAKPSLEYWLYFIPVFVFLLGFFSLISIFNTRLKKFKLIKNTNIIKSIYLALFQILIGIFKNGPSGLILGSILSLLISNKQLYNNLKNEKLKINFKINRKRIKKLAIIYIKFPMFSVWSILSNNLRVNSINFFISFLFSISSLGFYSLANRVISMPFTILGTSVGQAFLQKANEEKRIKGSATNIFNYTLIKLLIIAIPTFIIMYLFIEDIFAFVFGENWREAGIYAKALIPLFFTRFLIIPLANINVVFNKENISMIMQLLFLALTILIFISSKYYNIGIVTILEIYSYVSFLFYSIYGIILYKIAQGSKI